jgi:four helix bundle protein
MRTHLQQDPLEHAILVVSLLRPLVEAVSRRDRELGAQLRRAASSIALNIAEGFGTEAGNARLRFQTARGSLYETRAALRVAVAWGYIAAESAREALESLHVLGGRVYGLLRR